MSFFPGKSSFHPHNTVTEYPPEYPDWERTHKNHQSQTPAFPTQNKPKSNSGFTRPLNVFVQKCEQERGWCASVTKQRQFWIFQMVFPKKLQLETTTALKPHWILFLACEIIRNYIPGCSSRSALAAEGTHKSPVPAEGTQKFLSLQRGHTRCFSCSEARRTNLNPPGTERKRHFHVPNATFLFFSTLLLKQVKILMEIFNFFF